METKTIITKNAEETKRLAGDFAKQLTVPAVITLTGNLGAGKTTFVQGLAMSLGIKQRILSPTFLIIKKYELGDKNFYHVDLYRIENEKDLETTGLLDILQEKDSIVTIEWPENMGKYLPEKRIDIKFEYMGEKKRKITVMSLRGA